MSLNPLLLRARRRGTPRRMRISEISTIFTIYAASFMARRIIKTSATERREYNRVEC
jgi:hypothetical protein